MSFFKATWWRPASVLIVLTLALAALSAGGRSTALAVTTDGSVTVTPPDLMIGVGGTGGQVSVDMTPAAAGTSIWIIQIAYDPAVAQVATDGSGNPVCTFITVPSPFVGLGGCNTKAVSHGSTQDTLVILGGVVQNDNGTAKGFTTPQTLATFTFNANPSALAGAHTALTVAVTSFLGPNGDTPTAATSDGAIDITAGTSRIWGNGDCSADGVTSRDSQADLKFVLQKTPLSQDQGCPAVGASVMVGGVAQTWGNWDCSADGVTSRDSQADLKFVLQKTPLSQEQGCPAIGDSVTVS
jgi:hypothetical protein